MEELRKDELEERRIREYQHLQNRKADERERYRQEMIRRATDENNHQLEVKRQIARAQVSSPTPKLSNSQIPPSLALPSTILALNLSLISEKLERTREQDENIKVYNQKLKEAAETEKRRKKNIFEQISKENLNEILKKKHVQDAHQMDDRAETKKLASIPDPFLRNSLDFNRKLLSRDRRNHSKSQLYKSSVLPQVMSRNNSYHNLIDRGIKETNQKNNKAFEDYKDKRRRDYMEHFSFVKKQMMDNDRFRQIYDKEVKDNGLLSRKRMESQMKSMKEYERNMKAMNQKKLNDFLQKQMIEKRINDQKARDMSNSEFKINSKELGVSFTLKN